WFASRDPRAPWYAKWLAVCIVAYVLSPIDLIPDFIPVLGYLDEIILLPAALWLVLKLMPPEVLVDARAGAQAWMEARRPKPRNWIAAAIIVVLWTAGLWALWIMLIRPCFFPTN
ncbi:MAG: YkvA family protein, partial [Betaproteobacteria bacterium]